MPQKSPSLLVAPWIETHSIRRWVQESGTAELLERYGVTLEGILQNFLHSLQPNPSRDIQLGYMVPINVYELFSKEDSGEWHFDPVRMEFYTNLFRKVNRPVVINLRANHFVGEDALVGELMAHESSFARLNDGTAVRDNYYSNSVFAPNFSLDESLPLNRYRFGGFRRAAGILAEFNRHYPGIIHAITLAGELHHFLPELANPMAAGQFEGAQMTDYSPESCRDFITWLKTRHKSLEQLNSRFGTGFSTWEEVEPPRWDMHLKPDVPAWSHMDSYADGRLPVFGWARPPLNGTLTVYLDGSPIGDAEYGLSRLDVYEAIPEMNDSDVGFRFDIDFSKLPPGQHDLHVVFEKESGRRFLVGARRLLVEGPNSGGSRERGGGRLDKLPGCADRAGTFACLDHPPGDLRLRFNPYAGEWQEFREGQVGALLKKFFAIALQSGIPAAKLFSHQIVPQFEGTWNRIAFAVPKPAAGDPFSHGIDLYGGATVYPGLREYLDGSRYAVPEMHPRMGKIGSREVFLRSLEYHRDLGAAFICPYFMALREPFGQRATADPHNPQDGLMIHPLNVGLGSLFFYSAIVRFLNKGSE